MSANVPATRLGPVAENQPEAGWGQWLVQIARGVNFLLRSLGTTPITSVGDAAYLIVQSDRIVETSTVFTGARTWTLPPANSVDRGYEIAIIDAIATITATNTLTVALSGADTIDGTAASLVLNTAGSAVSLVSDGLSNWAIKTRRTVASADLSDTIAPTSWTPTDQSGAALAFTNVSARYEKIGNSIKAYGSLTYPATGSGAVAKISLPVAVPNIGYAASPGAVFSSAGAAGLVLQADANATTATFRVTPGGGVTNASLTGAVISFSLIYPAA